MPSTPKPPGGRRQRPRQSLHAPTTEELAAALDELVTALLEHRAQGVPAPLRTYFIEELRALSDDDLEALDIVADPLGYALRHGMTLIGQLLAKRVGSVSSLLELVKDVCNRDPVNADRRLLPIESAFNGVITGNGGTWVS